MSSAFGLARLAGGIQGPFAGYLIDKAGPRSMVVAFALFGDMFGRLAFATRLGVMTMVYSFISAATPLSADVIFDATDSYFGALVLLAILLMLAGDQRQLHLPVDDN